MKIVKFLLSILLITFSWNISSLVKGKNLILPYNSLYKYTKVNKKNNSGGNNIALKNIDGGLFNVDLKEKLMKCEYNYEENYLLCNARVNTFYWNLSHKVNYYNLKIYFINRPNCILNDSSLIIRVNLFDSNDKPTNIIGEKRYDTFGNGIYLPIKLGEQDIFQQMEFICEYCTFKLKYKFSYIETEIEKETEDD
ncbi:hypothetical protein H8356DRAFT_1622130 [Neocallimastix lanati (nom. inval.)]|jgi:hypothetical protein|nr:hypothetical protein H8356DRAFT_1622130 [Neocallimastix sp. JGI-2020a]